MVLYQTHRGAASGGPAATGAFGTGGRPKPALHVPERCLLCELAPGWPTGRSEKARKAPRAENSSVPESLAYRFGDVPKAGSGAAASPVAPKTGSAPAGIPIPLLLALSLCAALPAPARAEPSPGLGDARFAAWATSPRIRLLEERLGGPFGHGPFSV